MKSEDYEKGYLQGQIDEADITYRNIISILNEMTEEPTDFTIDWINELEEFLKKHGKL
ncbi:hypothetical protein [Bacillus cereus group sp. BfR-BA-01446]|uniref:hypothetical protein n=1 Tax=Bacillus cereus group sp. BfR-BA-01446 TaxID=2920350 RepID=UPI001F560925|nr:hypothetical protein [Bacillus cereus group sp. BfR-BA-01446]